MINILKEHLKTYPLMQIQDVAKLIYQNEFGGGHMISDSEKSLKRIQEEYAGLSPETLANLPVIESIGDGMCRIYLSLLAQGVPAHILNQLFVESANRKKGSIPSLESKLALFISEVKANRLPFSLAETLDFIEHWKADGYPAISHSDLYRESYHPAYRVVEFPSIIAIDGMSGSGKSTLGHLLHKAFPDSVLFHMDDYFLQPHQRTEARLNEIGGNVDYERFKEEIILHLHDEKGFLHRNYDCCTQTLGTMQHTPHKPLIIIEGSYSMHPYFGNYYDFGIVCKISAQEQKERILKRNGEWMWKRFESEWIPKENEYFDKFNIL